MLAPHCRSLVGRALGAVSGGGSAGLWRSAVRAPFSSLAAPAKPFVPAAAAAEAVQASAGAQIFVRNLATTCKASHVRKAFAPLCGIVRVVIPPGKGGTHSHFAFVTLSDDLPLSHAEVIAKLDGSLVQGNPMYVKMATNSVRTAVFTALFGPKGFNLATSASAPKAPGHVDNVVLHSLIVKAVSAAAVLALISEYGSSYNARHVATTMHSLGQHRGTLVAAALVPENVNLLKNLVERATASIIAGRSLPSEEWSASDLSNLCWSVALINRDHGEEEVSLILKNEALLSAVAAEAPEKLNEFSPQALTNVVWAYATMGVPAPALFEVVEKEAMKRIQYFHPEALANISYAFAKAGIAAPSLFDAVAAEVRFQDRADAIRRGQTREEHGRATKESCALPTEAAPGRGLTSTARRRGRSGAETGAFRSKKNCRLRRRRGPPASCARPQGPSRRPGGRWCAATDAFLCDASRDRNFPSEG
ncbi:hypothetical protein M885DRAFT_42686 [Pelagophyceae sp. CCMP2097]|nr:hypothetical protein M885DRAFT_42686 [Pelagophyceae sp. CCMP2097]|mmetsp:Transcript_11206/g.39654  ORF Transcript_11206/g.39654 Transcript_11206/m.39654 type:complete len:477 (-) Transcript_11206:414-1844(-)